MRRCLLRAVLLKAARRMRQAVFSIEEKHLKRRRIMKQSTWQWASGLGLGTAVGVGLLAIGLTPWIVAAAGVAAAVAINRLELK